MEDPLVEVWMVRHGETVMNALGRLCGWSDVALTDGGRRQARWLGDALSGERFDQVWSSDLNRAVETARMAGFTPVEDERLREVHFGELEGQRYETLPAEHKTGLQDFATFSAPGGEDLGQLTARVNAFLDGLEPGRHLVFAHGGVLRAVMRQVGPDRFLSNGALMAVDWSARALLFVRENEHGTASAVVRDSDQE
jgi:probable phosphoglycerate mutase